MEPFRRRITRRTLLAGATGAAASALLARSQAGQPAAPVWDAHTHLSGVTGSVTQRVDQLLQYADRVGIERLVVFMGAHWSADPSPDDLRKQNDDVLQAVAHAPQRLFGFVYLNPKHVEPSLAEMDRCVRDGPLIGVKLWVAMHCNRPELDPIVRRAVELKIPVLQHAFFKRGGNQPGESTPADLSELAARHPDANFICAHTGGDWETGIRAIRARTNVFSEICGSDPTMGQVKMAVRELGAGRVIYGSDAGGRSFASQLAKVECADLSEADKRLVLCENLRRLLAPACLSKGVKL